MGRHGGEGGFERLAALIYMLVESVGVMTRALGDLQGCSAIKVKARRLYVSDFDALRRSAGE